MSFICVQCGQEFWVDTNGVSYHWGLGIDDIDHDADGDHVPIASCEVSGCNGDHSQIEYFGPDMGFMVVHQIIDPVLFDILQSLDDEAQTGTESPTDAMDL